MIPAAAVISPGSIVVTPTLMLIRSAIHKACLALQVPAGRGKVRHHRIHLTEGDTLQTGPEIRYRLQLHRWMIIENQVLPDIAGHHTHPPVHEVRQASAAGRILVDDNDPGKLDMGPTI